MLEKGNEDILKLETKLDSLDQRITNKISNFELETKARILTLETKSDQFIRRSTEKLDELGDRISLMKKASELEEYT